MANNLIQIKRSATTATPPSLNAGELAFSNVTGGSGVLFIGSTDGATVVPIGGVRNPGVLTANQALVANSTSAIDKVIVANLVPTVLWANGAAGTTGNYLAANATGGVYWAATSGITTNTAAQYTWSNTQTFQNTITFSSTINIAANAVINSTAYYWVGNTTTSPTVAIANSGLISVGNSTTTQTTGQILVQNTAGLSTINAGAISTTTLYANVIGATANLSTSVNSALITVGTSVIANTSGVFTTGQVNGASHTVGTNFIANSTQLTLSNIQLSANGGVGSQGQVLASNGATGSPYWTAAATGTVTSVATSNGIGGGTITSTGTLYAIGNNGIVANSTGIWAKAANGISVDSSGINVLANTGIVSNTSGVFVNPVLSITDLTLSGNLIVSGTVTSINTTSLVVKDNVVELGSGNITAAADAVDMGWFSPANTSSVTNYAGLFRIAASSSATNPFFRLLATDTNPNTATTVGGVITTGTLQSYLAPYGTGGAFIANSTAVQITANSTVAATLTINSVSLSTALAATSGGTGQSSYATGDLLYASSSSALSKLSVPGSAANGQVLQITNNLPAYGTLDGGTF